MAIPDEITRLVDAYGWAAYRFIAYPYGNDVFGGSEQLRVGYRAALAALLAAIERALAAGGSGMGSVAPVVASDAPTTTEEARKDAERSLATLREAIRERHERVVLRRES